MAIMTYKNAFMENRYLKRFPSRFQPSHLFWEIIFISKVLRNACHADYKMQIIFYRKRMFEKSSRKHCQSQVMTIL